MSELFHECGIAAIYHLPSDEESPLCPDQGPEEVSRIMPRMLLDIQNRGQLAAGFTTYSPNRNQLIDTHRDIGTVQEVFRLSHRGKSESLMKEYAGRAAIGHVRYATCGQDDRSYAQPFERHHLVKHKWFSFAFNGQLSNYSELRDRLLADDDHHLSRETDTEIIMHELSREMTGEKRITMFDALKSAAPRFDGAYSLVMLNAYGEMLVARDPYGIKPLCYAVSGPLFAAASESVALINIGFEEDEIRNVEPGQAITITDGKIEVRQFIESKRKAHCFFEWIYFANVASTLDGQSVYVSRTNLGEELAAIELERNDIPLDDGDTIVVPVPDTSKAAADAMAFKLGIPSREGLIRNRYSGRTFIESGSKRRRAAEIKYTPLREVLEGKRIFLVEDSIVRSTTMKVLINRLRERGGAKEIHVRVACPPIIAPCFYGIDMSTISELFAPKFMGDSYLLTEEMQEAMAQQLGADSLRYLPVDSIARAVNLSSNELCQACITGEYPTEGGERLYQIALETKDQEETGGRTYERRAEEQAAQSTGA
ncbi:amidophosphoribosyltransferase [Blastopirellula marina]|uniref:Amidophosphoribosyltransferase n=1 Tax=Blastopirellula marina TaxID=124 RepID=A0A2S8G4G2_9BACT|nr:MULTISPECIES: amidophosphoribosyltransferase [Pirellulaceae]PQO39034.1 amidophosphoribosyltransferase [Blastopirellula marina]RCS55342.1 amidophosphoribosyltransferase [Bremerella cremea]